MKRVQFVVVGLWTKEELSTLRTEVLSSDGTMVMKDYDNPYKICDKKLAETQYLKTSASIKLSREGYSFQYAILHILDIINHYPQ